MTELIVDIGNIEIPDGFRKDRAWYKAPSGQDTFLGLDGTIMCDSNHDTRRIVLIPDPQPYVWPPWCRLWGAAMDADGDVWFYTGKATRTEITWDSHRGKLFHPRDMEAVGMPLITEEHFTDWKTPLLNPHWKGER